MFRRLRQGWLRCHDFAFGESMAHGAPESRRRPRFIPCLEVLECRNLLNALPTLYLPPGFQFATGSPPQALAVGDFNGDGRPDLALIYRDGNRAYLVVDNDNVVNKAASFDASSNPLTLVVSDFNGDGKLDIAVTYQGSSQPTLLLGKGDGTFILPADPASIFTGLSPASVIQPNQAPATQLGIFVLPPSDSGNNSYVVIVAALDASGTSTTNFTGTAQFTSVDPTAQLPAVYTFTPADGGLHAFTATLGSKSASTRLTFIEGTSLFMGNAYIPAIASNGYFGSWNRTAPIATISLDPRFPSSIGGTTTPTNVLVADGAVIGSPYNLSSSGLQIAQSSGLPQIFLNPGFPPNNYFDRLAPRGNSGSHFVIANANSLVLADSGPRLFVSFPIFQESQQRTASPATQITWTGMKEPKEAPMISQAPVSGVSCGAKPAVPMPTKDEVGSMEEMVAALLGSRVLRTWEIPNSLAGALERKTEDDGQAMSFVMPVPISPPDAKLDELLGPVINFRPATDDEIDILLAAEAELTLAAASAGTSQDSKEGGGPNQRTAPLAWVRWFESLCGFLLMVGGPVALWGHSVTPSPAREGRKEGRIGGE